MRSKLSRLGNIASIVAITCVEDLEDYDLLLSPAEPVTSNTAAKKLSQAEAVQLLKVRSSRQRLNSLLVAHCSHEMCSRQVGQPLTGRGCARPGCRDVSTFREQNCRSLRSFARHLLGYLR